MNGSSANRNIRLVEIKASNLRNKHIYIRDLKGFLPDDCFGAARKLTNRNTKPIEIELTGLDQTIQTDIPVDAKTGKPRGFLRERTWVGRFFEHHQIKEGDRVALERLGKRRYRMSPENANGIHSKPKAAEFFAGIGLVRLALEQQGWEVVFANDIDPDKAKQK